MNHRKWKLAAGVAAAGFVLLAGPTARSQDKKEEPKWYETYNGHELWNTNLAQALTTSTKENKPLLVDFYKRH